MNYGLLWKTYFTVMLLMATVNYKYKRRKDIWRHLLKFDTCCLYLAYNLLNSYWVIAGIQSGVLLACLCANQTCLLDNRINS